MIRIKSNDFLDYIILIFMLMHVLILRWLGLPFGCLEILLILILLSLFSRIFFLYDKLYFWLAIFISFYPLLSCVLQGGNLIIALRNTFRVTLSLCILIYISYLIIHKRCFLLSFLKKACLPLNIYMLINIPIIYLQSRGYYWLSGITNSTNRMREDMMSGLLGFNGTPFLAMFMVSLILLNILCFNQLNSSLKKTLFGWYNIALIIFSLILPLFNENNGYYFVFAGAIFVLFIFNYLQGEKSLSEKVTRFIRIFIPICLLAILLLFVLFRYTKIGDSVTIAIHNITNGYNLTNNTWGSSERIGMITYALRSPDFRWFGYGLAKMQWTTPNAFGFAHFGQSDFGVFLILGGIFYVGLIIAFLYLISKKICHSRFCSLLLTLYFILVSIFTQLFTQTTLIISTSLIFSVIILFPDHSELTATQNPSV